MSDRAPSPLWTAATAAAATGGTLAGGDWAATGVSIDSRSLAPGDLFVALTDQRDGHEFVAAALKAGAAAALVSRRPDGVPEDAPLLIVDDVLAGLTDLARAARARMSGQVIAVTGSVGKTGTKDMLRTILGAEARVHAAEKSFNNHWGVPLTLARMPEKTDFAVIEIGMNHAGEIGPLSRLTRPHVAIITTVAAVHLAAFTGVRQIAHAKAEIFEGLEPGGTAILNRDIAMYPVLLRKAKKAGARLVRFGFAGRPEFALKRVTRRKGRTGVIARHNGARVMFKVGAPGKHLAMNALAVLAAVEAVGADITRAALKLANWTPPDGRGTRVWVDLGEPDLDGAILLLDDSYNANPTSMEAALDVLAETSTRDDVGRIEAGRRIAILGDMLELGETAPDLHAGLADLDAIAQIDRVHTVGPLMTHLHRALPVKKRGQHAEKAGELARMIGRSLDAGDVVMVKGSLGIRLQEVVDAIKNLGQVRPEGPRDGG